MEKDKKKRSPNYTNDEKETLLDLVAQYKNIIECKRTGAYYIQKKKEAWVAITKQYNSMCTTGPRDEGMLKHFYNNIKHRARKVSACENKQRYLSELPCETHKENIQRTDIVLPNNECYTQPDTECVPMELYDTVSIIDENVIINLKKKWTDEKKNIKKTGGGSFNPTLNDADHQILSILDDQILPDANPYDEAAEYFGETIDLKSTESRVEECTGNRVEDKGNSLKNMAERRVEDRGKSKKVQKSEYRNKSAELLKRTYFRKKIELVYYQKKNEMRKFRCEKIKHDLTIKILKNQLEKSERDLK